MSYGTDVYTLLCYWQMDKPLEYLPQAVIDFRFLVFGFFAIEGGLSPC